MIFVREIDLAVTIVDEADFRCRVAHSVGTDGRKRDNRPSVAYAATSAVRGTIVCFKSMGSGHRFAKIHQKAWGRDVWKEEEIGFTRF